MAVRSTGKSTLVTLIDIKHQTIRNHPHRNLYTTSSTSTWSASKIDVKKLSTVCPAHFVLVSSLRQAETSIRWKFSGEMEANTARTGWNLLELLFSYLYFLLFSSTSNQKPARPEARPRNKKLLLPRQREKLKENGTALRHSTT